MTFRKLIVGAILAGLFGAAFMCAAIIYQMSQPQETACQISVNKALVDIPTMAKRMDRLEARIQVLESK